MRLCLLVFGCWLLFYVICWSFGYGFDLMLFRLFALCFIEMGCCFFSYLIFCLIVFFLFWCFLIVLWYVGLLYLYFMFILLIVIVGYFDCFVYWLGLLWLLLFVLFVFEWLLWFVIEWFWVIIIIVLLDVFVRLFAFICFWFNYVDLLVWVVVGVCCSELGWVCGLNTLLLLFGMCVIGWFCCIWCWLFGCLICVRLFVVLLIVYGWFDLLVWCSARIVIWLCICCLIILLFG